MSDIEGTTERYVSTNTISIKYKEPNTHKNTGIEQKCCKGLSVGTLTDRLNKI